MKFSLALSPDYKQRAEKEYPKSYFAIFLAVARKFEVKFRATYC